MSKIYVVGIGPGSREHMTISAVNAIEKSNVIIGYKTYINFIQEWIQDKMVFSNGMKKEIDRCKKAIEHAINGDIVCIVSSGDAGVYGMAGLIYELIEDEQVDVEVVPGVTAANSAAACLGAPLMHDYVVISLSDLMTDWELIKKKLTFAGQGDFVVVLYNPKSIGRPTHIIEARDILLKFKKEETPVGIVRNAKREEESICISNLKEMPIADIDMLSVVIIGNSNTYIKDGKMVTPRGYQV